jgi:transglutaminase-like putative cysteine protease
MFAHHIRRLDRAPSFDDDQLELTVEQSRAAGHYLFAPRPVLWVQLDNPALVTFCERTEGRLFVRGPPEAGKRGVGSTSFKLRISTKDLEEDPSMASAISKDYADLTRKVPAHLTRLGELASELTSDLGDDEVTAKIDRVVAYLSDLTRFEYSLDLRPIDRSIDPVEDFLFNRKRGHCEYFASSAALLLRAAGVSTRIVNGFKGADFNDAGGFYQVPQLLAHAWVEAYDPGAQRWLTVDPTPGESRELGLARSRFLPAAVVNLLNLSSRIWDRYVMDFSALDQATFLTGLDFEKVRDALTQWMDRVPALDLPGPSSLRVLVLFLAIMAGVLLGVAGLRVVRRGFGFPGQNEGLGGSVFTDPSYDRWLDLLRRLGLVRLPSQTPLEFARAVEARLAEVPALIRWQGFPREMANWFYAGRYGAQPLDTANRRRLAKQINDFAKDAGEAWKE